MYKLQGRFRVVVGRQAGRQADPGTLQWSGDMGAWAKITSRGGSGRYGRLRVGAEEDGRSGSDSCFWAARTDSRLTGGG
jgi:hypothetical protein